MKRRDMIIFFQTPVPISPITIASVPGMKRKRVKRKAAYQIIVAIRNKMPTYWTEDRINLIMLLLLLSYSTVKAGVALIISRGVILWRGQKLTNRFRFFFKLYCLDKTLDAVQGISLSIGWKKVDFSQSGGFISNTVSILLNKKKLTSILLTN